MAEEERRRQEEARRAEEAKRRADDARRQEESRQAFLAQQRAIDEARRARERVEAEKRAAAQAAATAQKVIDEYTARIRNAIREKVVVPPGIVGNPQAEFEVKLLKNGTVATVRLVRASGSNAYDREVERAIELAQPLPVPDDPELFAQMRDLRLLFRPRD
ncbi:MAG: energy transducer TonB [Betaproteobacteria bacterium]